MKKAYLGIDVSKGYADFVLTYFTKQILRSEFRLADTRKGHDRLGQILERAIREHQLDRIICGLESTGGYENNWHYMLSHLMVDQILVKRLNPRGVRHEKEASLVRSENDKVSAQAIAVHLVNQEQRIMDQVENEVEFYQARKFYRHIQSLVKDQSRVKGRLEKLVYESFPELLGMIKAGSVSKWMVNLLSQYPSAQRVANAQLKSLAKIRGVSKEKAELLKGKAKSSVGVPCSKLMEKTIQAECMQIKKYEALISKKKKYLEQSYTNDQIELLLSMRGMGYYSAVGLVMEIENTKRYAKASSVSSYFGVYPEFKQSGDGKMKPRMSKKGRASCRAILYMAARNVVIHNDYFKNYYAKFRAKGMNHSGAIGVVMNKLLRVVWGMLTSGKPFNPQVDKDNQKKACFNRASGRKAQSEKTLLEAPLSARKRRKIKAMLESQDPVLESSTRSSASLKQT
jgi:transposase